MIIISTSWMRRLAAGAVLATAPALIALGAPAASHAETTPAMGCETINWGFLGSDRRKICDGPKEQNGTWQRTRTVFTPAHVVPLKCSSNDYSTNSLFPRTQFQCSGGYFAPESVRAQESYVVAPDTVLPDEPGWLPPGTNNIL